jgi:hypothetical protein
MLTSFRVVAAHRLRVVGIAVFTISGFRALFPVTSVYADPELIGQWSGESPWPTVAVHMSLLPDGRILTWGKDLPPSGSGVFPTFVVSIPSGSTDTSNVVRLDLQDELFCSGETLMPDGRVWVSGGQEALVEGIGTPIVQIFDPVSSSWSLGPTMSGKRWYPTTTALPDGEILNLEGSVDENFTGNQIPDVSINKGTGMRSLSAVAGVPVNYNYPRAFVAPNGKVFIAGMESISRYLDVVGNGSYTTVAHTVNPARVFGTAVMYDIGKVLIAGGGQFDISEPFNTAEVIDLNSANPTWRSVGPMAFARRYLNATLMADGKVLITGGTSNAGEEDATGAVLPAEIWDPTTEQFTIVASMPHFRTYHSTAALLPDGRVISAGTTSPSQPSLPDQLDADFYSPPYVFKGPRPAISSAPSTIGYGQKFLVQTPDAANIVAVNWIRLSAVTHHFNFNQRINRLKFAASNGTLLATSPPNANHCPPGHYLMFLINSLGVPSLANTIQIAANFGSTPTPTPTATPTAIPGDSIKILAPSNGASVSGRIKVILQATSGVKTVNVSVDGGKVYSGKSRKFRWNSRRIPVGTHTMQAIGNASTGTVQDSITITTVLTKTGKNAVTDDLSDDTAD